MEWMLAVDILILWQSHKSMLLKSSQYKPVIVGKLYRLLVKYQSFAYMPESSARSDQFEGRNPFVCTLS